VGDESPVGEGVLELGEGGVSGELGFGGVVEEDAAVEDLGFAGVK